MIGGSFIGTETVSCLALKYGTNKSIHLIVSSEVPLQAQLGKEIGTFFGNEAKANGIKVHSNSVAK